MGWGPSTPAVPDPVKTAAAQTASSVATGTANAYLNDVNQVTPDGALTYTTTGQNFVNDPTASAQWVDASGQYHSSLPTRDVTTTSGTPASNGVSPTGIGGSTAGGTTTSTKSQSYTPDGWKQVNGYFVPQRTATTTLSAAQQAIKDQTDATGLNLSTLANVQSGRLGSILSTGLDTSKAAAAGTAGGFTNLSNYSNAPQLATTFGDAGSINNNYGTTIANAGDITKSYGTDYAANVKEVQDALSARLQPSLDKDSASVAQQAANQGIAIGSTAYKALQADLSQRTNDARLGVILNAGQEQNRLAGLAQSQAQFQNAAQQQQYSENANDATFANSGIQLSNAAQQQLYDQQLGRGTFANTATQGNADNRFRTEQGNNSVTSANNDLKNTLFNQQNTLRTNDLNQTYAQRNQAINEILALNSGAPVSNPNFVNTPTSSIANTDVAGITQQSFQDASANAAQKQAAISGVLGGLFGLGNAAIKASDRRVKSDIDKVGEMEDGQNVYSYRYKGALDDGEKHIGLMAQEVEKRDPGAVVEIGGVKHVDYDRALKLGSILRAA